jgi:long-chain acyl-CoA synthetase
MGGPGALFKFANMSDKIHNSLRDQLKLISYAGGQFKTELIVKLIQLYPNTKFMQSYGQTECGAICSLLPEDHVISDPPTQEELTRLRCSGKHNFQTLLRVVDDDGNLLPDNELGHIVVRSSSVFNGYLDMPEESAKTFRNGWMWTGDMGFLNKGYITLSGRNKDIINISLNNGYKVFPADMEDKIMRSEEIGGDLQACVFSGVSAADSQQELACFLVVRDSVIMDKERFLTAARQVLSTGEMPNHIYFVNEIPFNENGKVLRIKLRAMHNAYITGEQNESGA